MHLSAHDAGGTSRASSTSPILTICQSHRIYTCRGTSLMQAKPPMTLHRADLTPYVGPAVVPRSQGKGILKTPAFRFLVIKKGRKTPTLCFLIIEERTKMPAPVVFVKKSTKNARCVSKSSAPPLSPHRMHARHVQPTGRVDRRLSGKGNSNSHGAGPVY